ncbi:MULTISPECIES: helix-turn-helix domain-containing protein [Aneurinibacillus]|nr:helix-turn-helix domain-containing protein [Aneurinibacillus danicus]
MIDKLCAALDVYPGDLLEYIPDSKREEAKA